MTSTIAQISTAPALGAVAIIRISGGLSLEILKKLFVRKKNGVRETVPEFKGHRLYYGIIKDDNEILDEVLVSYMPAPYSYTKEDVAEINCHGGRLTADRILKAVLKNGAVLAAPGEFTKRAFLNGRIDLSQAEAVADLIGAETELASRVSLRQLSGGLKQSVTTFREKILSVTARIEASLDFPEHDLESVNLEYAKEQISGVVNEINTLLEGSAYGKIIEGGISVAVAGNTNVGKSSLFNAILNDNRAIVTSNPGTTRDIIEERVNIGGIIYRITDTAGIRKSCDEAEQIGIERACKCAAEADLAIIVTDGSKELSSEDIKVFEMLKGKKAVVAVNKCDLPIKINLNELERLSYSLQGALPPIHVSAKKREGIDKIFERIKEMFVKGDIDTEPAVYKQRHMECLTAAKASLEAALTTAKGGFGEDLITSDLTEAYNALGEITGETAGDDVINRIFEMFCIGK